jgi:hypothetical protein
VATFLAITPAQAQFQIGSDGLKFDMTDNKQPVQASSIVMVKKSKKKTELRIGRGNISTIPAFEIGWNVISSPNYGLYAGSDVGDFFNINEWKSTQFTVNLFQASAANHSRTLGISAGLGIRANNYRFASNQSIERTTGIVMPYEIGRSEKGRLPKKSKFNVASVHIPVEVFFGNPYKFAFSMGGYVDMVMNSHTKIKYYGGKKDKVHNYPVNFIQAGATARLSFSWISIYAAYQPTQIFKSGRGPEAQQWTIGIGF